MTEQEALDKMIAPGTKRPGKYRQGVIQIWTTNVCDKSCFGCTQGGNLFSLRRYITVDQFEQAVISLKNYWGVVGVFGANPALHEDFPALCHILAKHIPWEQRGLWCNHPITKNNALVMRETFNPAVSNINVHLDQHAHDMFKAYWPESMPVGLDRDSRHSPPFVAMKDVVPDESERWALISDCDINKHWSAMIGVFRGELRAWFCEIAGAQSMLHQDDPDYPDTGVPLHNKHYFVNGTECQWWELPMLHFSDQVSKHCHECGIPLRGYGELAQAKMGVEQTSKTHESVYKPKRLNRRVELVMAREQLGQPLDNMTRYLQNASK